MHPKFIVFEGLDGSGQSTQAKLLQEYLEKKGIKVLLTKEPDYEKPIGKMIRSVLQMKEKIPKEALQLLFTADRFQHVEYTIKKALNEGKWVISDRYVFSTLAYGSSTGIYYNWLKEMNKNLILPDAVFYLDTKPETCIERIEKRNKKRKVKKELFEELEKLRKIKEQYDLISHDLDYKKIFSTIDGENEIFEIHRRICEFVDKKFII
ncbi:MAG: dTMP kinase [Candidatus Nanoarchaeia archaeon]|nr:dTMP kinase [Candidatus Omnitrophota bacterium]MDD5417859.1 dTMP kinase [Candidatus Nanoarchaeia archaeon]